MDGISTTGYVINEYFYKPVKIVFIQCDVKLICLLMC